MTPEPGKYIDIGINLFCRQFPDPDAELASAEKACVTCILTGSDAEENRKILDYLPMHPGTYGTLGIHPHNADRMTDDDLQLIRDGQSMPGIVAVGECGLDFDRMFSSRENQIRCLERQLQIALDTGKPLFLHERKASSEMVRIFRNYPDLCSRGVIHCFTGNRQEIETYLDMGFMIGITGWICDDRRADDLRDAVQVLPLDRVMLETDAPYLTPRNIPGLERINHAGNIRYVAEELARYMHVSESELMKAARDNTRSFFSI